MLYVIDRVAGTVRLSGPDSAFLDLPELLERAVPERRAALEACVHSDQDMALAMRWRDCELAVRIQAATIGETRVLSVDPDPGEIDLVLRAALRAASSLAETTERLHREAGHALRTPLQLLQGQLLLADTDDGPRTAELAAVGRSAELLAAAVTRVVDGEPVRTTYDVAATLQNAVGAWREELASMNVLLSSEISTPCRSPVPAPELLELLGVLVAYGVHRWDLEEHPSGTGPTRVALSCHWDPDGDLALDLRVPAPTTEGVSARPGTLPEPAGTFGALLRATVSAARGQLRWTRQAEAECTAILLYAPAPSAYA